MFHIYTSTAASLLLGGVTQCPNLVFIFFFLVTCLWHKLGGATGSVADTWISHQLFNLAAAYIGWLLTTKVCGQSGKKKMFKMNIRHDVMAINIIYLITVLASVLPYEVEYMPYGLVITGCLLFVLTIIYGIALAVVVSNYEKELSDSSIDESKRLKTHMPFTSRSDVSTYIWQLLFVFLVHWSLQWTSYSKKFLPADKEYFTELISSSCTFFVVLVMLLGFRNPWFVNQVNGK